MKTILNRSSQLYEQVRRSPLFVREDSSLFYADSFTERHLQCVWHDPALRPNLLRTHCGAEIEVLHPGTWNLEDGPDFKDARLSVHGRHEIRGDIEIHLHPSGWKSHGHHLDNAYSNVCLHVTAHPSPVPQELLPPGCFQASLHAEVMARFGHCPESIDVTAYPYGIRADHPPCATELKRWDAESKTTLLKSAGITRMQEKGRRLEQAIEESDAETVLYQETMVALGYKHNKDAFRELSVMLPAATLHRASNGCPDVAYALLAGSSGLLPTEINEDWDSETKTFIRLVWMRWSKHRSALANDPMGSSEWNLSGVRPANHPLRRMAAAAQWFSVPRRFLTEILSSRSSKSMRQILTNTSATYWDNHLSFGSGASSRVALLGRDRANAIISNVLLPFAATQGTEEKMIEAWADELGQESANRTLKLTSGYLFGPDYDSVYASTGIAQQGLLQIFHDFCLQDRTRCERCKLPKTLQGIRMSGNLLSRQ